MHAYDKNGGFLFVVYDRTLRSNSILVQKDSLFSETTNKELYMDLFLVDNGETDIIFRHKALYFRD